MSRHAWFGWCCFLLFGLSAVREARAVECVTPLAWQPRAVLPFLDQNGNYINDAIDALAAGTRTEAIVYFNHCPSSTDLAALAVNGSTVDFASKYLSVAVVTNVLASDARAFAQIPSVAFVDEDRPIYESLDVSSPVICARSSTPPICPATVEGAYPLLDGTGVTIAFLDSGINDGVHESLPAGKFVGGADVFTLAANPVDQFPGHGTAVAGIALGTGGATGTYRGIAPAAKLADVRIFRLTLPFGLNFFFLRGAEKLLDKHDLWDVKIATLAFSDCTNSNGHDVASEMANRIVSEGIFVVAAAGNRNPDCFNLSNPRTPAPGAADDVVSVANYDDGNTLALDNDGINSDSFQGPRPNDGDMDYEDEHKPDLAAPGTNIHVPQWNMLDVYFDKTGTSFAAAHVAGCAALALQANPNLPPYDLKVLLTDNAIDGGAPGWDPGYGYGLVNCYAAIHDLVDNPKTDVAMDQNIVTGALFPTDPHIISGQTNVINVLVKNFGPVKATKLRIDLGVFDFGNSEKDYHICRQTYNNILSGDSIHMSCVWTPKKTGESVHACLKARVVYPNDLDFDNNFAQHNVEIEPAHSPANFHMSIVNPTDQDLTMHITTTFPQGANNWTLTRSPVADFPLASAACPTDLLLSLTPPASPGGPLTSTVDIAVEGITSGGVHIPLGGGTIIAEQILGVPGLTRRGAAILVLLLMGAGALLILLRRSRVGPPSPRRT